MGRTEVNAVIIGPQAEREFTFLVDTGSTYVGLPADAIEDLGLIRIPGGRMSFGTPDGVVVRDTYGAFGRVLGRGFNATIISTSIPLIGRQFLDNLGFRINRHTNEIAPHGADEFGPPYLVSQWLAR